MGTTSADIQTSVQLENLFAFQKQIGAKNASWKFVEAEVLELSGSDNSRFAVLKVVDILSQVVYFFDMEDKRPEYIAKVLQSFFLRYGLPRLIRFLNPDSLPLDETMDCLKTEVLAFEECINLVHSSFQDISSISQGMSFKIMPVISTKDSASVYDYLEDGWKKDTENYIWNLYICTAEKSLLSDEVQTNYIESLIKFLSIFSSCWKEWLPLLSFCMQTIVEMSPKEKEQKNAAEPKVPQYIKAIVGPTKGDGDASSSSSVRQSKEPASESAKLDPTPLRRRPGRPRKIVTDAAAVAAAAPPKSETTLYFDGNNDGSPPKKRGRGRPRKDSYPVSEPPKNVERPAVAEKALTSVNRSAKINPFKSRRHLWAKRQADASESGEAVDQENQSDVTSSPPTKRYSFREVLKPKGPSKFIKYFLSNCSSRRSSALGRPVQSNKIAQRRKEERRETPKTKAEKSKAGEIARLELKDAPIDANVQKGEAHIKDLQNGACMLEDVESDADSISPSADADSEIMRDVRKKLNSMITTVELELGEASLTHLDDESSEDDPGEVLDHNYFEDDSDDLYDPSKEEYLDSSGYEDFGEDDDNDDSKNFMEAEEGEVRRSSVGRVRKGGLRRIRRSRHFNELAVKCPFCSKTFVSSREELRFHLKFHKIGISGLICPECGRNEKSWVHMSKHISKHRELKLERLKCVKLFTKRCPKCDREFSTTENLVTHFENKHIAQNQTSYLCCVCNESFMDGKSYILHYSNHDTVVYECDRCAFVTYKKSKFESHKQSHENNTYKCTDCGRCFKTETGLTIHLARDKHVSKERSLCEECGCSFTSVYYLKMHNKRMHQESENHPCPHCPYVGTMLCNLKQHIERTHIKEYTCDLCSYATKKEKSLLRHKAAFHDESRTAVCPHCGYRGPSKKHVSEHIRMQHNPTLHRFACQHCTLTFKTMTQLRDHMPSHTGETPYACRTCGYRCKYRQTMHMHVKKRHPGISIREGIEGPRDRRDRCEKPKRQTHSRADTKQLKVEEWITDSILQEGPEVSVITDNNGFSVEETIAAVNSTGSTIYMDADPINIDGNMTYKIVQESGEVTMLDQIQPGVEILLVSLNPPEEES